MWRGGGWKPLKEISYREWEEEKAYYGEITRME